MHGHAMDFVQRKRWKNFSSDKESNGGYAGQVIAKENPVPVLSTSLSTTFLDPLDPANQQRNVVV